MPDIYRDFWNRMGNFTRARVGLGGVGTALPTKALLDFQLGHASARDAVHHPLDLSAIGHLAGARQVIEVRSRAADRATYLRRPDLGRLLASESEAALKCAAQKQGWDILFVIADGLSSRAAERWAIPVLNGCLAQLGEHNIAPLVIATQARVALADHIAETLGARAVVMLLGERPGLSVADSLGLYFTWSPHVGTPDSRRNCISNIHRSGGLAPEVAAAKAVWLIREAMRLKLSGVGLKENAGIGQIAEAGLSLGTEKSPHTGQ